jgi:hypothetical protein
LFSGASEYNRVTSQAILRTMCSDSARSGKTRHISLAL